MSANSNTSGVLTITSPGDLSFAGWFLWTATPAALATLFSINNGTTYYLLENSTGSTDIKGTAYGAAGSSSIRGAIGVGVWAFIAGRVPVANGATCTWISFRKGLIWTTATQNNGSAAASPSTIHVGEKDAGTEQPPLVIRYFKLWNTLLSTDQLKQEVAQGAPINGGGLWSYLPMASPLSIERDRSGFGNNWTVSGTYVNSLFEPPVPEVATPKVFVFVGSIPAAPTWVDYAPMPARGSGRTIRASNEDFTMSPMAAPAAAPSYGWSSDAPARGQAVARPPAAENLGPPLGAQPSSFMQWAMEPQRAAPARPPRASEEALGAPMTFAPSPAFVGWGDRPQREPASSARRADQASPETTASFKLGPLDWAEAGRRQPTAPRAPARDEAIGAPMTFAPSPSFIGWTPDAPRARPVTTRPVESDVLSTLSSLGLGRTDWAERMVRAPVVTRRPEIEVVLSAIATSRLDWAERTARPPLVSRRPQEDRLLSALATAPAPTEIDWSQPAARGRWARAVVAPEPDFGTRIQPPATSSFLDHSSPPPRALGRPRRGDGDWTLAPLALSSFAFDEPPRVARGTPPRRPDDWAPGTPFTPSRSFTGWTEDPVVAKWRRRAPAPAEEIGAALTAFVLPGMPWASDPYRPPVPLRRRVDEGIESLLTSRIILSTFLPWADAPVRGALSRQLRAPETSAEILGLPIFDVPGFLSVGSRSVYDLAVRDAPTFHAKTTQADRQAYGLAARDQQAFDLEVWDEIIDRLKSKDS